MHKLVMVAFAASLAMPVMAADMKALVAESRGTIKDFVSSLKAALVVAVESGGPLHAIGVCNMDAPAIVASQSVAFRGRVGRTSLRCRNPANAPDSWEHDVLNAFEVRLAAGEGISGIDHAEVVRENGRTVFRYMKAIPTGGVCLTCHGDDLDPEIAAAIDARYPDDQARGFAMGDIRGAFTVRRHLD